MIIPSSIARSVTVAACLALGATAAPAAELLAGVASNGRLVLFASDDPSEAVVVQVHGLEAGEHILGLDRRPAGGLLYALGSTSRIYTLDVDTGEATAVGSGPLTPTLSGTRFGFDFNPTVDRIRIVSDSGQNLRVHPDTGVVVSTDMPLAYAMGDAAFGSMPAVAAAAYTNNDTDPATATTLYDIDETSGNLVTQLPPNDGKLNTVGPLGVELESVGGFDIAGSDGTAYAGLVLVGGAKGNNRRTVLYTVDLATGAATKLGKIGGPKVLGSLTALGSVD
jgi:hypothetical protein